MTEQTQQYLKYPGQVSMQAERGAWENFRDGLYSVKFFMQGAGEEDSGEALAILREGSILGSDKFGGVFEGRLVVGPCGRKAGVSLRVGIPPGGVVVTGKRVAGEETVLEVVGELSMTGDLLEGVCDLDGGRLVVNFRYIGVLP